MTDRPLRVLQVGDIGGVGGRLSTELVRSGAAVVERLAPPMWAAGRGAPWKQAALAPRAAVLAVRTRRAVRRARPDLIHLHWARFAPFMPTAVPLVVHAHGSDIRGRHAPWRPNLVERSLRRAALVLVSTPDLRSEVGADVRYLPNPVDTVVFAPAPRPAARPCLMVFARFAPIKGADRLLAIVDGVRRAMAGAVDVIGFAGGVDDERARAAGVDLLPPARSPAEVAATLQRADVVLGQQAIGSLGLSELEAMACAKPVVVHLREELGVQAPVRSNRDVAAGVEACVDLLGDATARAQLGAAARAYVVAHHATDVVARQLHQMYEEVLGAP